MAELNASTRIGALEAGGTKMVLAVGKADGTVIEQESMPTTQPETVVPRMAEWFAAHDVEALGIGSFGPTGVNPSSPDYGFVLDTPKPGWAGYDFLGTMQGRLGIPVGYDIDVNVACLGELTYGCARGLDVVVYLTVGTGIGAGVAVNGELLHGMLHPEAGHILLQMDPSDPGECVCPFHDRCFEGLASGPSIEARWGAPAKELDGRDEVWNLEADYIAQALCDYVLCYSPQRIILGGGVMHQEQVFPLVREKLADYLAGYIKTPELEHMDTYVVPNSLHEKQGIMGCLELGRRALEG
ncbi:MAG: ROK family protein [Atopobiaceae bacterium]|jgi:fructokinase|nr:ROK family protein [Atopobiaceae bacterium]MCH4213802.1 ROK family protein [Atopobiaceae bacterium]MCH4275735.1 ROK family protein [Atopobiaceae bacterium]MCI1226697.1 ROK family protein [Atopobiaceae bacterium]MCI1259442.1 ROK family protein [Atopobiaceae bacterium]